MQNYKITQKVLWYKEKWISGESFAHFSQSHFTDIFSPKFEMSSNETEQHSSRKFLL